MRRGFLNEGYVFVRRLASVNDVYRMKPIDADLSSDGKI